ncbi:hypothetical protein Trydic_g19701 [Trypoxylus dichotomus]
MEVPMEREAGALGGLFQQIIQDMKNGMPLWEDLIAKATKLHSTLKAAILAVTAYLEAFQKIADAATNARVLTSLFPNKWKIARTVPISKLVILLIHSTIACQTLPKSLNNGYSFLLILASKRAFHLFIMALLKNNQL